MNEHYLSVASKATVVLVVVPPEGVDILRAGPNTPIPLRSGRTLGSRPQSTAHRQGSDIAALRNTYLNLRNTPSSSMFAMNWQLEPKRHIYTQGAT